jgi:hypothetical protein
MQYSIEYEVIPCGNVPDGMARLTLAVLSPVWRGPSLELEYPDGEVRTLMGRRGAGAGQAADLQVFWTRREPGGPAVGLIIGATPASRTWGRRAGRNFPRAGLFWPWPRA